MSGARGGGSWRPRAAWAWVGLALALAGCGSVGYVARAGWAEARILWRREPIADLLARHDLEPALRERLALTLAVRRFAARELGLAVGDSYTTFAEVDGDATVHVVTAARRDRLEPHTWWYPIVGRMPYRGFFARPAADTLARELAGRELDVEVRTAIAFSTLGWFADPLLSSVASGPPVGVAETIIHELFHATLFVPGQAAFNESAATFAGHRGAVAFFCAGPGKDATLCSEARRDWTATRARGRVLGRLAVRLRQLYATRPALGPRERTRARLVRAAERALRRRGIAHGRLWPPNNARILGDLLYLTDLDAFDALAPHDADLGPALARLVQTVADARDPVAAVRALASRSERR